MIAQECAQIIKKSLAGFEGGSQQLVGGVDELLNGMDEKGHNVQSEKHGRQIVVAMPKIVFEVIAMFFEDIVAFVFVLPTGSSSVSNLLDIVASNKVVGDPSVVIEHSSTVGVGNGQFKPVDA